MVIALASNRIRGALLLALPILSAAVLAHAGSAATRGPGCSVAPSPDLSFFLIDGSKSINDVQFGDTVTKIERAHMESLIKAKRIPDVLIGVFGSTARASLQTLTRLSLQSVRKYDRRPCAVAGFNAINRRLAADRKRVRQREGSAILEAIYHAGGPLHASTGVRRLVIFSDMVEESSWATLGPAIRTETGRAEIIGKLRNAGHVPNLSGVTVCIVGFDTGSGGSQNPRALRLFWESYFRQSKGRIGFLGSDFPTSGPCMLGNA